MDNTMKLRITFILLAVFSLYFYGIKETFVSGSGKKLNPDKYPSELLLKDWYPVQKPAPHPSKFGEEDQYKNYPIFPAHSTNINNLKQWRKPNNGRCVRAEMCGDFYEDRSVTLPMPAQMPGFDNGIRVNFYNTD
jgi:hypothetical protein